MRKALAIDVGGTKIYNTIVNEKGEIISEIEKRHTPKTFAEIKQIFKDIIACHEDEVDVIAIQITVFWVLPVILQASIRLWISRL